MAYRSSRRSKRGKAGGLIQRWGGETLTCVLPHVRSRWTDPCLQRGYCYFWHSATSSLCLSFPSLLPPFCQAVTLRHGPLQATERAVRHAFPVQGCPLFHALQVGRGRDGKEQRSMHIRYRLLGAGARRDGYAAERDLRRHVSCVLQELVATGLGTMHRCSERFWPERKHRSTTLGKSQSRTVRTRTMALPCRIILYTLCFSRLTIEC